MRTAPCTNYNNEEKRYGKYETAPKLVTVLRSKYDSEKLDTIKIPAQKLCMSCHTKYITGSDGKLYHKNIGTTQKLLSAYGITDTVVRK